MTITTSRELPPLATITNTRDSKGNTLYRAVLSAPWERKSYSDRENVQAAALPAKKRRVWYSDNAHNAYHHDIRCPEDDLMAFHTQGHVLNRDRDVLANVRNAPPDMTSNGALPPILLPRNGLLDGLAAIHNAPWVLLGTLPPIQTLGGGRVPREFYEPEPLRPWQLVGSRPSFLVDLECVATEQTESRVSFLNDDGTLPEGFRWELEEGSPSYSPSPRCYPPLGGGPSPGSDSSRTTVYL
ncbi:hypothetical protein GP486_001269 [Trichoglossum hirsutum]|uniref:Uncharacterized protein n=1 Tax=Trichoglossum hirsutum TaxID=265104 RepID=A0A9P8RT70_9PEZI|nr:hypothetical protein GP486_001269 [Trichoglossum hirsutum]